MNIPQCYFLTECFCTSLLLECTSFLAVVVLQTGSGLTGMDSVTGHCFACIVVLWHAFCALSHFHCCFIFCHILTFCSMPGLYWTADQRFVSEVQNSFRKSLLVFQWSPKRTLLLRRMCSHPFP